MPAIAGILQRAIASKQSDHPNFLFKLLPPWLRVLSREVQTAYKHLRGCSTKGPLLSKDLIATKRTILAKIPRATTKMVHTQTLESFSGVVAILCPP